ncbi:MAG: tetratricopeptide repeat protein [Terriglobales bacterium]
MFGFNPEKALANAEKLIQQNKTAAAVELYEKVLEQRPGDQNLRNNLGDLYGRLGRNADAVKLFRQIATQLEQQGQTPRAVGVWKKILRLDPDAKDAQQRLADLLISQGGQNEARGLLLQIAGRAEQAGDWAGATTALARILSVDADQPRIRLRLATARVRMGDKPRAQTEFLAASQLLLQRNDMDGVKEALGQLQTIDPDWPPYRLQRATVEAAQGQRDAALRSLPLAAELAGSDAALDEAARLAREAKAYDRAVEYGWALLRLGQRDAATYALEFGRSVLGDLPSASDSGAVDAVVLWAVGDHDLLHREDLRTAWLQLLRAGQSRDPFHLAALEAWSDLISSDAGPALPGQVDRAQRARRREVLILLGQAYEHHQQLERALGCFRTLTQEDADDSEAIALLHRIEEQMGLEQTRVASEPEAAAPISHAELFPRAADHPEEFSISAVAAPEVETEPPADRITEFALTPLPSPDEPEIAAPVTNAAAAGEHADAFEIDLAAEWSAVAESEAEDRIREAEFYFSNGMLGEAEQAVHSGIEQHPGNARLLELMTRIQQGKKAEPDPAVNEIDSIELLTPEEESPQTEAAGFDLSPSAETAADSLPPVAFALGAVTTSQSAAPAPPKPALPEFALPELAIEDASPDVVDLNLDELTPPAPDWAPSPDPVATAATSTQSSSSGDLLDDLLAGLGGGAAPAASPLSDLHFPTPAPLPEPVAAPGAASPMGSVFQEFRSTLENKADPGASNPEARYNMGVAYREMGLLEEAIAELQKAFAAWRSLGSAAPRLLSCGATIAMCFQEQGMPELAVQWYETTLQAAALPAHDSLGIRYELASLLESLDRKPEALQYYRQVYATDVDYQDVAECVRRLQAAGTGSRG